MKLLAALAAAAAAAAAGGAPTVSGPLTVIPGGGCRAASSCAFDYVLDPAATSDGKAWHAYWVSTETRKATPGWCELDATATLRWGQIGHAGSLPAATYPPAGIAVVGPRASASLTVDAAGTATTVGRLDGPGSPPGLVTTWVHRGYMATLWQGRASVEPSLTMAAETANPTTGSPASPGAANDYGVGLPCAEFAPPGRTFLARFTRSTIHLGQKAYLELRIPDTGLRWTVTSKFDDQTEVDGQATVQMIGHLGPLQSRSKPEVLQFTDRWTYETTLGFGSWVAVVTLRGPTGTRHYRIPITVRA